MESYYEKNEYLKAYFEEVSPRDFYREIFPEGTFEKAGELVAGKPNGIAVDLADREHVKRWVVTDDLKVFEDLAQSEFAITSPISYFGRSREGRNARYLHALTFDIDGVGLKQLKDLISQMQSGYWFPLANYICNSGNGVHLYYVFDEPVPMYPHNQEYLKELKYALTNRLWNGYTSTIEKPQMQGILQGFRIVGSQSKFGAGYPVRAYRLKAEPISLQELVDSIPNIPGSGYDKLRALEARSSRMTLEQAKAKWPEWYERRIERGEPRKKWNLSRAVYDYWLKRLREEIKVGHRYFAIMTLAIFAKKCSGYDPKKNPHPVTEDELRRDAYSLLEPFDKMTVDSKNHFDRQDVEDALDLFNEDYITFPKEDIAKLTALPIVPKVRRNGRKQEQHLGRIRAMQQYDDPEGKWREGNGRRSAEATVKKWRKLHPKGKKVECKKDTGLTYDTIRKWWE